MFEELEGQVKQCFILHRIKKCATILYTNLSSNKLFPVTEI